MLNFIKNWTLPIAMLAGVLGYLLFVHVPLLEPTKSLVNQLIAFLTPSLIFAQLLLTFCKVNIRDLMPVRWSIRRSDGLSDLSDCYGCCSYYR